jgi:hypothetical protein
MTHVCHMMCTPQTCVCSRAPRMPPLIVSVNPLDPFDVRIEPILPRRPDVPDAMRPEDV